MVARDVRARGRVQGVFFRAWTKETADELGVRGWVRNCEDGSVEAHLEGDEESVGKLVAQMHSGPEGARVDELTTSDAVPSNLAGFELRR